MNPRQETFAQGSVGSQSLMLWLGFYLNYFLVVVDACNGFNHKYVLVQVRSVHQHRFTHTTLIQPKKINQLYEAKALDSIPMCPRERLVLISITNGLSFAEERIGPLATIIIVFYCLTLYFFALSKTPKNPFAKYLQIILDPNHQSTPSAPCWVRHSYLSKIL